MRWVPLLLLALLQGCGAGGYSLTDALDFDKQRDLARDKPLASAEQRLKNGIALYERKEFVQAQRALQSSLLNNLASRADQATAHKYLAFIYCSDKRLPECRQEFGNALTADPRFRLTAAEEANPAWGPVYRSVLGR
ncbi:MAG: DUF4398 domain-containing protein [Betaproteobacteria bacterium]|nr:DUF4398 domain-containing protein [Betaproteobacteria bacterium]